MRINRELLIGLAVGAIGASALFAWRGAATPSPQLAPRPAADLEESEQLTLTAAESLRRDRYESVTTIEDVLALPTEFAEMEALYAMSGRAGSADVQDLIYQSLRVADPRKRAAMVSALLTRLVEVDPRSAVALVEGPLRRSDGRYATSVWQGWAARDFAAALNAAAETGQSRRLIAGALYGLLPSLDSARASEIEAVLGVAPGSEERALFLERLYQRSAAEAVQYVSTIGVRGERLEQVEQLAALVLDAQGERAIEFAANFSDQEERSRFRQQVMKLLADRDPHRAISLMLDADGGSKDREALGHAIRQVANDDPDTALAYIERASSLHRYSLEHELIMAVVDKDPERALMMAGNARFAIDDRLKLSVVMKIGQTDIGRALQLVVDDGFVGQSAPYLLTKLVTVAETEDLPRVAEVLTQKDYGQYPGGYMLTEIARRWAERDPDGAMLWAESLPAEESGPAVGGIINALLDSDTQRAVQYATALTGPTGAAAREQLTAQMVSRGLIDDALVLARSSQDPGERQRAEFKVIQQLVNADPERALLLAEASGNATLRDTVLSKIIPDLASTDPEAALQRAKTITDESMRRDVSAHAITALASQDFVRARLVVEAMADGVERDAGLAGLANASSLDAVESLSWAARIEDDHMRGRTQAMLLWQFMQRDPATFARRLDEFEVPEMLREQYEKMLRQRGFGP